jgi:hypothetical protein
MESDDPPLAQFSFEARVLHWRGPSPYFFAPIPPAHVEALRQAARVVTYGWGMIPVEVTMAGVAFRTALFPKDATYLLPLKDVVRRKTNVTAGDMVAIEMTVRPPRRPWR